MLDDVFSTLMIVTTRYMYIKELRKGLSWLSIMPSDIQSWTPCVAHWADVKVLIPCMNGNLGQHVQSCSYRAMVRHSKNATKIKSVKMTSHGLVMSPTSVQDRFTVHSFSQFRRLHHENYQLTFIASLRPLVFRKIVTLFSGSKVPFKVRP